jgi:hypothetical protein
MNHEGASLLQGWVFFQQESEKQENLSLGCCPRNLLEQK